MSDSNRRVLGVFAGIVALGIAFGSGLYLDMLTEIGQQRNATENSASDTSNRPTPSTDTPKIASAPASDVSIGSRDQAYYDNEDLKAQREMAKWTERMGQAAITGVFLSLVGIWLIWRTWDATREAAKSSRDTFQAYIAKERGHLKLDRAFITWSGNALDPTSGATFQVENVGLSSCTITRIAYRHSETEYRWMPHSLVEVSVSELVPADQKRRTPQLDLRQLQEGAVQGFVDYTTLETIRGRIYFAATLTYTPTDGYGEDRWDVQIYRPRGMPRDT